MADTLLIPNTPDRREIYGAILPQIEAVISTESDPIANLANIVAILKEAFQFFWVGFYVVKDGELVLAPFQGPLACTRIAFNRGVCGHAHTTGKTVLVPDVEAFPGHIACNSKTKSEIVVPIFNSKREGVAVLDVDSDRLNDFTEVDAQFLEAIAKLTGTYCF